MNSKIENGLPTRTKGLALVMALLILLVMTFMGVAMLNSASMQEKMSGNQKRIADSSMAAEASLQAHFSWLNEDPESNWDAPRAERPTDSGSMQSYGYVDNADGAALARFFVEDWASFIDYDRDPGTDADDCGPSDDTCVVTVVGQSVESVGASNVLAQTRLRAIMEYFPGLLPLGGAKDIWAGENVDINGNAYLLNAYMHSNGGVSEEDGNVSISGGRTTLENSRITANGEADVKLDPDSDSDSDRCVDCSISGDAGLSDPPPDISDRILSDWMSDVASDGTVTFGTFDPVSGAFDDSSSSPTPIENSISDFGGTETVPNCSETFTFSGSDLSAGSTYFVNGNVEINTSADGTAFENVTIISTCNMTHNGAMRQGGGDGSAETNNVFYSAGDMTFNGSTRGSDSTPFQGRFFSGGSVTQNGNSSITGQLIIEQSLTLNGEFSFQGSRSLGGNSDFEEGDGKVSIVHWSQVW